VGNHGSWTQAIRNQIFLGLRVSGKGVALQGVEQRMFK
jgi:hypothetical protein